MKGFVFYTALLAATFSFAQSRAAQEAFAPFTGKWQGVFKVFSYEGRLLDHITVEQHYWWESGEQHAAFIERGRDGRVVHAHARNYEKDGMLYCEVKKITASNRCIKAISKRARCSGIAGPGKAISLKASKSESCKPLPDGSIKSTVSAFTAAAATPLICCSKEDILSASKFVYCCVMRYCTMASASISTSISGMIRRLTCTMLVAGRIALKNSPCALPIFSHSSMLVT